MLLGLFLGIMWHQFDFLTSCLPTLTWIRKSLTNHSSSLQQILLFPSNSSSHFPPHSQTCFSQACMFIIFPRTKVKTRTLCGFSPLCMSTRMCLCVCVLHWDLVFSYTIWEERLNADDTISDAKNGHFFCSTTICSCRKFAFLPSEQHCSL